MKQLLTTLTLFLLLGFWLPLNTAIANPEEKGLTIALEADKRDSGFGDSTSDMIMILKNRHGQESRRKLRSRVLEIKADGNKSLTIYDTPKDVKGTAFLSFSHKTGDDDQWLYLPALKRVKRISSRNKSGSFMGSEFAYEDFSSQEVEKYDYKWIKDEPIENQPCFIVEYYPKDQKNSGYTRQVTWIDKKEYKVMKIEYFDRKDSHLKTLTFNGYKKYLDKHWRADKMLMVNHQNGKSTQLHLDNYKFKTGLTDRDFNKNSLKRAK